MRSSCVCCTLVGGRGRGHDSPAPCWLVRVSHPLWVPSASSHHLPFLPSEQSTCPQPRPFFLTLFGLPGQRSCLGWRWGSPSACKPIVGDHFHSSLLLSTPLSSLSPYFQIKGFGPWALRSIWFSCDFIFFILPLSSSLPQLLRA